MIQQSSSKTKSHQVQGQKLIPPLLLNLPLSLLLSILPHVMNLPPLLLLLAIPLNRRPDAAHSPLRAIRHPLAQILQLALRFGFLAAGVLLYAGLAQVLVAERVAQGFFGGADGLVPVWVSFLALALAFVLVLLVCFIWCYCKAIGGGGVLTEPPVTELMARWAAPVAEST